VGNNARAIIGIRFSGLKKSIILDIASPIALIPFDIELPTLEK